MTDRDLSNIFGMINIMNMTGISRYSLRSDIAQALFMFENYHLVGEVTGLTALDNEFAYMNFAFMIAMMFIIMYGIVIAAGMIAGEHASGTIKLLLIRPYRRWQMLLAKYITTVVMTFAMILITFILTYVIGVIFFRGDAMNPTRDALVIFNASRVMIWHPMSVMIMQYLTFFWMCIVYITVAMMISTIFKSVAGAIAASIFMAFAADVLNMVLATHTWYKYIIFNNVDLFRYFFYGPSLNDMTLQFSIVTILIYMVVIVTSSVLIFNKRDAN
jgi:ABC-2 type transport system permease protein